MAGAAVHPGEEDGEEGPPRHRVQEDPPGGLHPEQLRHGPGRGDLQGREQDARAKRPPGGVRAAAGGKLPHGGRARAEVSH